MLLSLNQYEDAIRKLEKATKQQPTFFEAHHDLGLAYSNLNQFKLAEIHFSQALKIRPKSKEANYNLAKLYDLEKRYEDALKFYSISVECDPNFYEALYNRAGLCYDNKKFDQAKKDYEQIINQNILYKNTFGLLLNLYRTTGLFDKTNNLVSSALMNTDHYCAVIDPLNFLTISDSPELQLKCATSFTNSQFYPQPCSFPKYAHSKIRIGYYSADFREHPVSYLIAELLELHNRSDFEIYAFSLYSPNLDDPLRKRIELGVDHFFDVASKSDQEIVDLSRKLEIDIAIDLGGHTKHARTQIFASRVAPVQVNYLGFPGTMGASFMDYIIADRYVIPEENQQFYSEKVVYLPGCFQPHDSKRRKSSKIFTRKELGLPENAFVYCCFNQAYKITPEIFQCWIEILQAVEGSVLWLIDHNIEFQKNILKTFELYFGDVKKVYFSPMIDAADNINRYKCADVFLDTYPFNAGTTASEVLESGTVIVSISGQSMASRYCGSLLFHHNLQKFITKNYKDYVEKAINLSAITVSLNQLKREIKTKCSRSYPDNISFVNELEKFYRISTNTIN